VPAPDPQILLKVRFASVDRSLEKQLGVNILSTGAANSIGTVTTGQFSPPSVPFQARMRRPLEAYRICSISLSSAGSEPGRNHRGPRNQGLVEILAEPNVLAENGKQASFLAGGEYPYPVVQGVSGTLPER